MISGNPDPQVLTILCRRLLLRLAEGPTAEAVSGDALDRASCQVLIRVLNCPWYTAPDGRDGTGFRRKQQLMGLDGPHWDPRSGTLNPQVVGSPLGGTMTEKPRHG